MIYLILRNNNPILNNFNGIRLELVADVLKETIPFENSFTEPWPLERTLQFFQDHKLLTFKEKIFCMDRVCKTERKNDSMIKKKPIG
ncbi:hypothetical protein F8M41_023975 [Gigaspora margarita]|uniref:Uncharacterized protein n=1 Tax=Gigaspora margarita TaxID=4874 RepID=A0A8H4EVF1_GIGMA|nr:hypothetical protein F8M41_023975 [Gigaspora margarita]